MGDAVVMRLSPHCSSPFLLGNKPKNCKDKGHMPKFPTQIKHVTKEGEPRCGNVRGQ